MRERRAQLDVIEVPDEGHAPLLEGESRLGDIIRFVERCETGSYAKTQELAEA
jgi:hypothetical protein